MADQPILFSGPMVRALIPGTKTQTRRALTGAALAAHEPQWEARKGADGIWRLEADTSAVPGRIVPDIRISIGDRLYVREHWRCHYTLDQTAPRDLPPEIDLTFAADGDSGIHRKSAGKFRQGMHMPRWASRITLTVTDVRVERLQDISEGDALAEGVQFEQSLSSDVHRHFVPLGNGEVISGWDARDCYGNLWEYINGPGSWAANPWVAAYTFTIRMGNIDALAEAA